VAVTDPVSIGRYQVIRRMATGGMGALYLARDPDLDRLVAIKLVKDDLGEDHELRARFAREARAVARLRHPNIVTIFDVGEMEGRPFIAMEYIPGESLSEVIRRKAPLTVLQKLTLMEALCAGLAHAHKAGIVHRDIKPANLMVDQEGTLKIVDFGIARLGESTMTKTGVLVGTLNYMSPEQVTGGKADARSDIFAAGAVFYELMTLAPAFPGRTLERILRSICQETPPPMGAAGGGIDREIERLVRTAIEKEASRRYQDIATMRRDIEGLRVRLMRAEQVENPTGVWRPDTTRAGAAGRGPAPDRLSRARQEEVDGRVREAQREFDEGRYQASITLAERALTIDPRETRARDLVERARAAIEATGAKALLGEAAAALGRNDLAAAAALAEQAAALVKADWPQDLQRDLHLEVRRVGRAVERERERARAARAALDRARERCAEGEYESAIQAADEALAIDPALGEAQQLVRQAEIALEKRRRRQLVDRAIERAEARVAAGDHAAAIEILAGFNPPDERVSAALQYLRAEYAQIERQRAEEDARRHAERDARRRAGDEARRRAAAEEAGRRADEEGRRRAAEEAQRRVAQEARRRVEEEAGRRAEEDARRRLAAGEKEGPRQRLAAESPGAPAARGPVAGPAGTPPAEGLAAPASAPQAPSPRSPIRTFAASLARSARRIVRGGRGGASDGSDGGSD
jgi:predicted Ser/Thr protein kinase/tetratricopeptide (TPR) repeat protein